jgi:DNA-binding MarR family transcriptional regulator
MKQFHQTTSWPVMPKSPASLRLESSLLYHCAIVSSRVGGHIHELCRERWGLSGTGWRVMVHVGELQPITAKEIGARAAINSVNLSRALAQLDELGFVERHIDPTDRRRIILSLTRTGQAMYDEVAPITARTEQELLSVLTASERTALRSLMKRVWQNSTHWGSPSPSIDNNGK